MFFFNDTATTEIYTLSLHDALPILNCFSAPERSSVGMSRAMRITGPWADVVGRDGERPLRELFRREPDLQDRKSTRLNSSHANISYAVFCLKKKKALYLSLLPLHSL